MWIYQVEANDIRVVYAGTRHNLSWNTRRTDEYACRYFMPLTTQKICIEGPYTSPNMPMYCFHDLAGYIEKPQPWQQQFMTLIREPTPGIWYLSWDRTIQWIRFITMMKYIHVHHLTISLTKVNDSQLEHGATQFAEYSRQVQVYWFLPTLTPEQQWSCIDFVKRIHNHLRRKSTLLICCDNKCPPNTPDITKLIPGPDKRHLILDEQ
jgi:hypothetical protein